MRNLSIILIFVFFFSSCGGFNEAGKVLRNEKIRTTDEFLVKKKEPLVMPPDYKELPKPDSINKKVTKDEDKIKKLFKSDNQKKINEQGKSSSLEKSILEEIKR